MSSADQAGGLKAWARAGAAVIVLTLAVFGWSGASIALASSPTITLSGEAVAGTEDPHFLHGATVDATLSNGVATGTLKTSGVIEEEGRRNAFEGEVTCMVAQGNRVVVGALGRAYELELPPFTGPVQLPVPYAQILTVEFGHFGQLPHEPASFTFAAQFGDRDEGEPSDTPPNCNAPYSWGSQHSPTETPHGIHLSPAITSPTDGSGITGHTVTLSGIAEPNGILAVYEVAQSSGGHLVTTDADGAWSTTFTGVPYGTHAYTAAAIDGSTVPANTVQVNVEMPAPSGEAQPPESPPTATPGTPGALVTAISIASPTIIVNNSSTTIVSPVIKLSLGSGHGAKVAGRHLALSVDSNTSGNATLSGYLSIRKGHRQLRLGSQLLTLTASHAHNVSLALSTTVAHQLLLAKRKGEPITALITITLRTGTGQAHTEQIALNVG
jgi:hypothetical protein